VAKSKARVPPRWFVVAAWHVHRWMVRVTGGRKGLWPPRPINGVPCGSPLAVGEVVNREA
jgi:hypothetical protein